ncbi:radical SAM protein [Desulfurococcaceae archaeon MEX13E-LK6-19]|nr:radical SAM protein [Desulfurococcaceae archaeon MEX13E-LK6-19]
MKRIALVYPSIYEAALSSLVFHMIYFMINTKYDEVFVERFVLEKLHGAEPEPRSLETNSPLKDFDVIIASLHYEPDYVNLLRILLAGGIEVDRKKRRKPLLFVGGPAPMSNPMPLKNIVDGVLIGEAEELIPVLVEEYLSNDDKSSLLQALDSKKGFYIPEIDNTTERVWVKNINETFYPITQIQSLDREPVYGRGFLLETARGCPRWCRFCLEGRLFKPFRTRSKTVLKKLVDKGLNLNNLNRVIIYSLFFPSENDVWLLEYLNGLGVKASLPSMRLDAINDNVLELIKDIGQKTITIAPENVSMKGLYAFCKCFRNQDIWDKPFTIIDKGFDLKMYFILGFKGESIDDVKTNIDYIKRIAKHAKSRKRGLSVTVNPLVPKPKTPFQWIGMIDLERAKQIISYTRNELRGLVDTRPLYVNWAWIQASIALADESIGRILVEWAIEGGGLGGWRRVLRRTGYSTKYVFTGRKYGETLPWDKVVLGEYVEEVVEKEYIVLKKLLGL